MFYRPINLSVFFLVGLSEIEVAEPFFQGTLPHGSSRSSGIFGGATHGRYLGLLSASNDVEDFDDWSDERKAGLFQFLLRDLEVEGVPLLACDGVSENKTLQGATWTVAGPLSENDYGRKVCLVLEDIPMKDLKTFVDMFSTIKEEKRLMDPLHDLRRFSLSLVGKGIGPALVLETHNRTESEIIQYDSMKKDTPVPNEARWKAAIESFVKRMFPELEEGPILYRFLGSLDVCDVLSGYWNCICELEASDSTVANSVVLSYPPSSGEESFARFVALSELINTMNTLYRSDYAYDLVYFHPSYDCDKIRLEGESFDGHLPSTNLLREMMQENRNIETTENLTDEQITLQNYLRKSPLPGVIIKRVSKEKQDVHFDYQSIVRLVKEGEEKLEKAVLKELELIDEEK